jgi:hypothetical protein
MIPSGSKAKRTRPSTTFSKQIIEPFLIVGGFRLVFGGNHAQFCAIDTYLRLDIASSRDFPEVADQLLPLFGDGEFREQPGRVGVRRPGHDGYGMGFGIKRLFDSCPIDGAARFLDVFDIVGVDHERQRHFSGADESGRERSP